MFRAPARPPFVVRQKEAKADLGAAAPKDPGGCRRPLCFLAGIAESSTSAADTLPVVEGAGRTGGPPRGKASWQGSEQLPLTRPGVAAIGAVVSNKAFTSQRLGCVGYWCGGVQ